MPRAFLVVFAVGLSVTCAFAGDLDPPPGSVAPTLKSLDEVEPRVRISQETTPGTGSAFFRISEPGSYYLIEDIEVEGPVSGIVIEADNVTIDLMGFELRGKEGTRTGVVASGSRNITLRNGSVVGWGQTGVLLNATGLLEDGGAVVEDIRVVDNGWNGMTIQSAPTRISRCLTLGNGLNGIAVATNATIESSQAHRNGRIGFSAIGDTTFIGCSAKRNGLSQTAEGFEVDRNCVLKACVSVDNSGDGFVGDRSTFIACVASSNDGYGFDIESDSLIEECIARSNELGGFDLDSGCVVRDSVASANSVNGSDGVGFRTEGTNSRFEANHAIGNRGFGFQINGSGNILIGNTAARNTAFNWIIGGNNHAHIVVAPSQSGAIVGDAGGVPLSSDPNANYTLLDMP